MGQTSQEPVEKICILQIAIEGAPEGYEVQIDTDTSSVS